MTGDGKFEPRGEKSSGPDQDQRNVVEERRQSSCKSKTEGDRRAGVEEY